MFEHYVMFKLKEERRGELQNFIAKLEQLRTDVPFVRDLKVVPDSRHGPKSYDVLYYAKFDDEAGFESYMKHPKHVPVQKYVEEVCSGIVDVDVTS